MFNRENEDMKKVRWQTKLYVMGTAFGAMFGLLSAYLFAREAEVAADDTDELPKVPASTLLGLALSAITLIRQISDMGRKKEDKK